MPDHPTLAEADAIVRQAYDDMLRAQLAPSPLDDLLPSFPTTFLGRWRKRMSIATSEWTWRIAHAVAALRGAECP